jgi:uncharacterized RDD family membrane protein YckC
MVFCAYCGQEISDQALTCPNCGHPNEARTAIPEVEFTPSDPTAVREYAGFWIRFGSLLIDVIIISLVTAPLGSSHIGNGRVVVVFNPFRNILELVYVWLMIALVRGQTLGMMLLGLRITRPNGDPVDLGRSAARAAMSYVSGIALLLGYLWTLWDPEKRTWHDMVADTRVYRVRR